MDMLIWLQESALAQWVGSAPTLLAYPTVLTLHTAEMSVVVGTCAVIDLRILGVAGDVPFTSFRRAPLFVWSGFTVNAITGKLLFLPAAEQKATRTAFFIKLVFNRARAARIRPHTPPRVPRNGGGSPPDIDGSQNSGAAVAGAVDGCDGRRSTDGTHAVTPPWTPSSTGSA